MLARMPTARPIVFLSDFGLGNEWVGLCHAVMSGIAPQCPIVDLSHLVRPLEVTSGAILLADAMPYVHESSVVLAVVDPNVGKDREIAIETESGRHLVGPDNGLLSLAWDAAGGIRSAVERLRAAGTTLPIEIEAETLEDVHEALAVGVESIQLDNMTLATMKEAVAIVAGRATLEASGGVSLETVREIEKTGVDFISVGALTHSARSLDVSLEVL